MLNQVFVVFVLSIALWQGANSFVIEDRQLVTDVTQSPHLVLVNTSVTTDSPSTAVVIGEEEIQPKQFFEEENVTSTVQNEEMEFSEKPMSTSSLTIKEGLQISLKMINHPTSTMENEKEETNDRHNGDGHTSANNSDEGRDKLRHAKHSEYREETEAKNDDVNNTNNDDYENDE